MVPRFQIRTARTAAAASEPEADHSAASKNEKSISLIHHDRGLVPADPGRFFDQRRDAQYRQGRLMALVRPGVEDRPWNAASAAIERAVLMAPP